jgi:hypothetical protein
MTGSAIASLVAACIWFGWPLCWSIMMLCRGCVEVSTIRQLNKYGCHTMGKAVRINIKSKRSVGAYGIVEFDYLFHDSTEQEKSYIGEQAVNTDLAMQLQGHSKETAVLYLPQKPYVARLA